MMRRVPIYVSVADSGLAVICNDGTVWTRGWGDQWHRQPDIPQDDGEE